MAKRFFFFKIIAEILFPIANGEKHVAVDGEEHVAAGSLNYICFSKCCIKKLLKVILIPLMEQVTPVGMT